ncbi:MAG: NPCBM/NEW2 domain-containing protein [Kiritimatiellae bacterium]|nr:NPCBM/NEW2 domain-containing protein [Kiritimatiellia bacterium]
MRPLGSVFCALTVGTAVSIVTPARATATGPPTRPPPVRVVYFVPADREPLSNRAERLTRTLEDVRRFYRDGMAAAGLGPLTFDLERDSDGRVVLHEVRGRHPSDAYGRNDAAKVRDEVRTALAARGIDADRELLLIVQVLLRWQDGRAIEVGPYVGGGDGRFGAAHVYDDERLDASRLASREPGGWYGGKPCSIGRFNTHYIGGIAHELGHAFGLPHDRETAEDRAMRGRSLMGSGNHTYGEERRGEGPGAFLSTVSAMQLRYARAFAGDLPDAHVRPTAEFPSFEADYSNGAVVLTGVVTGTPPVWAVAVWNDPMWIAGDYDAVAWGSPTDPQGRFRLAIRELETGRYELRLRALHTNGRTSLRRFTYTVDANGVPDVIALRTALPLASAVQAWLQRDEAAVRRLASTVMSIAPAGHESYRKAAHLLERLAPAPPGPPPAVRPPDVTRVELSHAKMTEASVGWGRVMRDEAPEVVFIELNGEFVPRGLWAHAPARHVFDLGGRWRCFRSRCGVHDHGRGTVRFVVRADGRELYRSATIRAGQAVGIELDVSGAQQLEMIVEDAGDGRNGDWGVWADPVVER